MARAIAIGESHTILGFKAAGFEIIEIEETSRLPQALLPLARDPNVALVLVTEPIAAEAPGVLEEFREKSPAILTIIPTHQGSTRVGFEQVRKLVERSLGVDILGKHIETEP